MKLKVRDIPKDFPVKPFILRRMHKPAPVATWTCGSCGLSWDDGKATTLTPAPSGRCPFEYFHKHED